MMLKYLRQLTQVSIINFFFILGLLFFIQKYSPIQNPQKKAPVSKITIQTPTLSVATASATPQSNIASPTAPPKNLFSELATHNSKSDCWLAVAGHIYDVTTYFGSHPGGDGVILKYCGTDATVPFQSKDGIGADHSSTAYDLLHQYLIQ
jgi:cytochrome b involved in lipid metabolism